jgi:hypothetical protein
MFRITKALLFLSLVLGVISLAPISHMDEVAAQGLRPAPKGNTPTLPNLLPPNTNNGNTFPLNKNNTNNNLTNMIMQKNAQTQNFAPKGYLGGGGINPPVVTPNQFQYSSPFFNPNMYQLNPSPFQNFNRFNNFSNFNQFNPFGVNPFQNFNQFNPFGVNNFNNFNQFNPFGVNNFNNFNQFANMNNPFNNFWNNNQVLFPGNLPPLNGFGVPGPQFNPNFPIPPVGQPFPPLPGDFNPFLM